MSTRLPAKPLGIAWGERNPDAVSLEVFVDFLCPFSRRIFKRLTGEVVPHFGSKLNVTYFPMPQPWHPQVGGRKPVCSFSVSLTNVRFGAKCDTTCCDNRSFQRQPR